jgi:DNA-binding transcriptional MerR regulator
MDLVSIDDFARLSGLSPGAMRLYDEVGLLPPARVDPDSGYRWYAPGQADQARLIVSLRHLGVPLARIATIVGCDPAEAAKQVAAFWAEAEFAYHGRRALAGFLVDDLTGRRPDRYDVKVRDMPARQVLCLRRHVTPEELVLVGQFALTLDLHVQFLRPARPGRLVGRGRVVQWGNEVCFLAGELLDPQGRPVAVATATARIRTTPGR